ncbi:MAG: DNA-3-methyladenine glycosylase [Planctomycetota bacterium]|nr:MAG: DNA-3-methyladenine glycosylase [Planctomycetota bacterium]
MSRDQPRPLSRRFFATDPETLARKLLGCTLARTLPDGSRLAGTIVETEAYLGVRDTSSHTYGGRRTERVASMWARPGTLYVYFTYGMHFCMNISAGSEGVPVAVLLRAIEPTEGLDLLRAHRTGPKPRKKPLTDRDLCSGPARLCQALAIGRPHDGLDLTAGPVPELGALVIERRKTSPIADDQIAVGPRVGLSGNDEWTHAPLRFAIAGSPYTSRPRLKTGLGDGV